MKIWLSSLLLFVFAAGADAQQYDNPVTVPVTYYGTGAVPYCPTGAMASISFGSSPMPTSTVSNMNPPAGTVLYSSQQTAYLTVGQTYNVTVTTAYVGSVTINFFPVNGCAVYVNGLATTSYTINVPNFQGTSTFPFQLTLTSSGDITKGVEKQRGGAVTSLAEDKAMWFIGLGQCRNGQFAGALGFGQATITPSLFNTSSLVCTATDPTEVSVTRDSGGHITQVQSRDVVLMVDPYNASGTSYNIHAYTPSNLTTPFMTYTIKQVTNGIEVDRVEDANTYSTQLLYSGGTWTRYDWQANNGTWTNQTTTAVSGSTNSVTYGLSSNTGGYYTRAKTYSSVGSQTEMTSCALGSASLTAQPVTNYSFYNATGGTGWFDAIQSIGYPNGSWVKYDYYNTTDSSSQGLVQHVYSPWGPGTPSSPTSATSTNCKYEVWTYTTSYDGSTSAPLEHQTYLDGVQAGDTKWAYNWAYETLNSHTIAEIQESDYANASASLTTTTLEYLQTDADTFFRGKYHSVTRPNGTKDSYAYYYGTWSASTHGCPVMTT